MRNMREGLKRIARRGEGRRRRAAALVEFAVVLPVLLTILFGIIEFGQIFMVRQTCQHAAREGCRVAVLQSTSKPYTSAGGPVYQCVQSIMTAAGINFSAGMMQVVEDTTDNPEVSITITVPYSEVSLTSYLGPIAPTISGSCAMRKEGT